MLSSTRVIGRIVQLVVLCVLTSAGTALAQDPVPRIPPDRNERARPAPLRPRCWERGPAAATDWLAERNDDYRRGIFDRYVLEPREAGWRWYRRQLVEARNLRPTRSVEGLADSELVVLVPEGANGQARYRVDGSLHAGSVQLEWSPPPRTVCANDHLDLDVAARIVEGEPGEHRIGFVLPLSEEQRARSDADVRACSPGDAVTVDSIAGVRQDDGRCRRFLDHLPPGSAWTLMVTLPESFYVIYRYEPGGG